MPGKFDRYWEMKEGGPYDDGQEVFKCKDCGAVSAHEKGWDGEPDPHQCSAKCQDNQGDWQPGSVSNAYRRSFDMIFPDAPGVGV